MIEKEQLKNMSLLEMMGKRLNDYKTWNVVNELVIICPNCGGRAINRWYRYNHNYSVTSISCEKCGYEKSHDF